MIAQTNLVTSLELQQKKVDRIGKYVIDHEL